MPDDTVILHAHPKLAQPRLLLAFSGWMDGGEVSTGSVEYLVHKLDAQLLAEIRGEEFYIYHFPGSMELSAMLRPRAKIEKGLVQEYEEPSNRFYYQAANNVILFSGREPNLHWQRYGEAMMQVAGTFGVGRIIFIGSVAGVVPHTREPRFFLSASSAHLREELAPYTTRASDYEGPASIATYLTRLAADRGLEMATLVAEIPAYVQGRNVRCIEAATRRLAAVLGLSVSLDDMRAVSDELERRLSVLVEKQRDLAELIHKLEQDYDNEVFDTQMGDLKDWLQERGLRLD